MRYYLKRDLFGKDGLFENVFSNVGSLKANILEDKDNFIIEVEVPGVNKENISLALEDGSLTVEVVKERNLNEDTSYLSKEIGYGKFSRTFALENVIEENIKAKTENGILFITVSKAKPVEPQKKTITIE
jgi:HSP20 family protein